MKTRTPTGLAFLLLLFMSLTCSCSRSTLYTSSAPQAMPAVAVLPASEAMQANSHGCVSAPAQTETEKINTRQLPALSANAHVSTNKWVSKIARHIYKKYDTPQQSLHPLQKAGRIISNPLYAMAGPLHSAAKHALLPDRRGSVLMCCIGVVLAAFFLEMIFYFSRTGGDIGIAAFTLLGVVLLIILLVILLRLLFSASEPRRRRRFD